MNKAVLKRLSQLERLLEPEEHLEPVPVIFPEVGGGFLCRGVHYESEDAAKAAFPDADFCVVVQVVDGRRQHMEAVADA